MMGLHIDVYEVLDKEKEVNTDSLKREINNCLLIISERLRWERDSVTGISSRISRVYYIITDYDADDKADFYEEKAKLQFGKAYISDYKYDPNGSGNISTIYTAEKLGRV